MSGDKIDRRIWETIGVLEFTIDSDMKTAAQDALDLLRVYLREGENHGR
jgi:hypothetical protein